MLHIESTQKFKHKIMALEILASDHERFGNCKHGKFQAPEVGCDVCRAFLQALTILKS